MSKVNPIVEETTPLEKSNRLLYELYETVDDVMKVITLIKQFPVLSDPDSGFSFNSFATHGLFVVLRQTCGLLDESLMKIDCVREELASVRAEHRKEMEK